MSDDEEITAALAAALPKGEHNGLAPYARLLADFPRKVRVCVALVDCTKSTLKHGDGTTVATARIKRIELITDEADAKIMSRILLRAFETRTGAVTLPFELEADVKSAFEDIQLDDPDDVRFEELEAEENRLAAKEAKEAEEAAADEPENDPTAGPWFNNGEPEESTE